MTILAAVAAAAIPTTLFTLIIWWLDRYEKEPLPLLAVAFLWGSLPAIGLALFVELVIQLPAERTFLEPGLINWGLTPLVEELTKAIAIVGLFVFARSEFDGPLDGIVYGALVGFGFAMTENLIYFLRDRANLQELFWLRAVLFGSNHAFFSSLVGLALGLARYRPPRQQALALASGLSAAVLFHAMHNTAVDYQLPGLLLSWLVNAGGVVTVLLVATLAWRRERALLLLELPEEVRLGVISERELAEATSLPERLRQHSGLLLARGPRIFMLTNRLYHLITELAFCKYQVGLGDRYSSCEERDRIRQEIGRVRRLILEEE